MEASKGYIDATAGDNIYLASQSNDLVLDQARSGTNSSSTVPADIKIKSADGIYAATGTSPTYNVGSAKDINLILEASGTSIGTSTAPLLISATSNTPVTAEGNDNVYIQQVNGDLLIQQVTAVDGAAQIAANGSIYVDTAVAAHTAVEAESLDLESGGNVGFLANRLEIQLASTGSLTGTVADDAFIESTAALNVGKFTSTTGDVNLLVDTGDADLGQIMAADGTVTVFTSQGDIVNANLSPPGVGGEGVDISGSGVTLTAEQGNIGTSTDLITIDTSSSTTGVVNALANDSAYIDDVNGDLRIDAVAAETGDVVLIADDNITSEEWGAGSEESPAINVCGVNISLTAMNGGIGTSSQDLLVDSSDPTPGVLNATAENSIYITQTAGSTTVGHALNVGQVLSSTGNIRLTIAELPDIAENMVLSATSFIEATVGNILLQVGSNFDLDTGSTIQAGGTVEIYALPPNPSPSGRGVGGEGATFSPDPGTTFNLFGQMCGTSIYVHGDDPGDVFNIGVVVADEPMTVEGYGANDTFNVASDAPTDQGNLSGIQAALTIIAAGGGSENRLIVSDFSEGMGVRVVTFTNSSITGFAPATIDYSGINGSTFNDTGVNNGILLQGSGTAATTFDIQSTLASSTTMFEGGAANDTFNFGSSGNSLAGILGTLTVNGGTYVSTPSVTLCRGTDSNTLPTGNSVNFNDQGDQTTGLTYDLYATSLATSLLTKAITFLNIETVTLNTGIATSTTNIHTTGPSTNTFVNGNALTPNVVNVLNTGASSNVSVNVDNSSNNAFYVQQTGAASFTEVAGGSGNDSYFISSNAARGVTPGSGSLNNIHGVLYVAAGSGTDNRLFLDNFSGTVNSDVVFGSGRITGLAANAVIDYSAVGGFNDVVGRVDRGDGILLIGSHTLGTTFTFRSTLIGSTITVEGGLGNDTFNVGSPLTNLPNNPAVNGDLDLIEGLLTIVGNGGNDNLEVDDRGATGAFNYILTPTSIVNDPSTQPTTPTPTTPPARHVRRHYVQRHGHRLGRHDQVGAPRWHRPGQHLQRQPEQDRLVRDQRQLTGPGHGEPRQLSGA